MLDHGIKGSRARIRQYIEHRVINPPYRDKLGNYTKFNLFVHGSRQSECKKWVEICLIYNNLH